MKNIILLISLAFLSFSTTVNTPVTTFQDVFICNSKNGKKYHFDENCRSLKTCKASIKKLSLADARKIGKTICGWED